MISKEAAFRAGCELAIAQEYAAVNEAIVQAREWLLLRYMREAGTKKLEIGGGLAVSLVRKTPKGSPSKRRRQRAILAGQGGKTTPWERIEYVKIMRDGEKP